MAIYDERRAAVLKHFYDDTHEDAAPVKHDKSLKGSMDVKFRDICDIINTHADFYTTSCCSGRLACFVEEPVEGKTSKKCGYLVYVAHSEEEYVDAAEIIKCVDQCDACYEKSSEKTRNEILPGTISPHKNTATLRFEPLLLHVKCRSLEAAMALLRVSRQAGLKEIGITGSTETGIDVRICGSVRMACPIKIDGKWTVNETAIGNWLDYSRRLMSQNDARLKLFFNALQSCLSAELVGRTIAKSQSKLTSRGSRLDDIKVVDSH